MSNKVLRDVITRTSGDVYIGIVGSVRSGKSSFIRKFMELKVLPLVTDEYTYKKIQDELPQSGEGKTIMTVEPKFIPSNTVSITVDNDVNFQVRMVDCVGYLIPSAQGYLNEDGSARLVQTPWFSEGIPFEEAAKLGTKKVIDSHSNIGIVLTSDGSFGEFSRDDYAKVEKEIIEDLKEQNKPFVIVVNTVKPTDPMTLSLVEELEEMYNVGVVAIDVANMTEADVDNLLKVAMNEFDISELNIEVPSWVDKLNDNISYKSRFKELISETTGNFRKMKEAFRIQDVLKDSDLFSSVCISSIDAGTGVVDIEIGCSDEAYNEVVNEIIGEDVCDKGVFIENLQKLAEAKRVYDVIGSSMERVETVGYDIALPKVSQMELEKPSLLKDGTRFGIKIKATAPMIQLVKMSVSSTFEPIIGSKEQAEELINHMIENYETDPEKLWNSEIFGRKLCDVINDGMKAKVNALPESVLEKFRTSMEKLVNYGKGGIIAIVL